MVQDVLPRINMCDKTQAEQSKLLYIPAPTICSFFVVTPHSTDPLDSRSTIHRWGSGAGELCKIVSLRCILDPRSLQMPLQRVPARPPRERGGGACVMRSFAEPPRKPRLLGKESPLLWTSCRFIPWVITSNFESFGLTRCRTFVIWIGGFQDSHGFTRV